MTQAEQVPQNDDDDDIDDDDDTGNDAKSTASASGLARRSAWGGCSGAVGFLPLRLLSFGFWLCVFGAACKHAS
jgi:hypothetical protein